MGAMTETKTRVGPILILAMGLHSSMYIAVLGLPKGKGALTSTSPFSQKIGGVMT